MRNTKQPVYMIGVAAQLCGIHPQTLRQYEKLGLVIPARVGAKNRLYSENDIARVKQIQRLTQDLGVNLAGVDIILKLLDDMEDMRYEFEQQFIEFARDAELRMTAMSKNSNAPVRQDTPLVPVPKINIKRRFE
ncbi:MerR family transcriptional regulator [bacterium]|jgi:MerR family transcriptional regulator, heat shock protein HspR|nr:hypothetical protein CCB80_08150 [Armatimonadetes bacterium Uphvl-Ar1]MBA4293311.1 MerR family transcriptional regulator [bacterium]